MFCFSCFKHHCKHASLATKFTLPAHCGTTNVLLNTLTAVHGMTKKQVATRDPCQAKRWLTQYGQFSYLGNGLPTFNTKKTCCDLWTAEWIFFFQNRSTACHTNAYIGEPWLSRKASKLSSVFFLHLLVEVYPCCHLTWWYQTRPHQSAHVRICE